jgi:hypothetical protein
MKKIVVILTIIIALIILYQIFNYHDQKMETTFICVEKYKNKELARMGILNSFDWMIISDVEQKHHFEKEGYSFPNVDFSKNYLLFSKYKVKKLYRSNNINNCTGVPDGKIIFDKFHSRKDCYYFYLMPTLMLSQGVG